MKQILADELGILGSGERVYDRPDSHVQIHMDGQLEKFLPLALKKIQSKRQEFVEATIDFGIEIGKTNCVKTGPGDQIVFAQRKGREGLSRFVMGKDKIPTTCVTIILRKMRDVYVLVTAYFGPKAPPEPWDKRATAESESFWNEHALVWNEEEIIPGTTSK